MPDSSQTQEEIKVTKKTTNMLIIIATLLINDSKIEHVIIGNFGFGQTFGSALLKQGKAYLFSDL